MIDLCRAIAQLIPLLIEIVDETQERGEYSALCACSLIHHMTMGHNILPRELNATEAFLHCASCKHPPSDSAENTTPCKKGFWTEGNAPTITACPVLTASPK